MRRIFLGKPVNSLGLQAIHDQGEGHPNLQEKTNNLAWL